MKRFLSLIICITTYTGLFGSEAKIEHNKEDVLSIIDKVNSHWQTTHTKPTRAFWDHAAYHTGNMEAYFLTKNEKYREYSERWAKHNKWQGAKSTDKSKWRYKSYGEGDEYVLFGDWQICFQTYIDLYNIAPEPHKISRTLEVIDYQINTPNNDYWWWVDGLYMVMPVMTKLYGVTKNPLYLEKLYTYWNHAKGIMYDKDENLFYRDGKYIYPKHKTVNGKKDFWARGMGWVMAALPKVLNDLPLNDPHREEYIRFFKEMSRSVIACQQPEGHWTRSMLDKDFAPGFETSGTAFFTYALFWGINNGILDKSSYLEPATKAWNYLSKVALQPDSSVGYVQPIGEKAIPGQVVNMKSTSNFGVGAFLLASCEVYRFLEAQQTWTLVWSDEFNTSGKPNKAIWNFEEGYKRNHEDQWYQSQNSFCKNGKLIIEARAEKNKKNPDYVPDSKDWRKKREFIEYTSSCMTTAGNKEFLYGRFEVRAKIPTAKGAWPAIWTLGNNMQWPSCGEIDIMEYYQINDKPHILANAAWGNNIPYNAIWDNAKIPFKHFTDKNRNWAKEFHIWRMDWDAISIRLYLDNELLNEIPLAQTQNGSVGNYKNPFKQPHYILLNLAIGGDNGGTPNPKNFPLRYEIDYVRVYQLK